MINALDEERATNRNKIRKKKKRKKKSNSAINRSSDNDTSSDKPISHHQVVILPKGNINAEISVPSNSSKNHQQQNQQQMKREKRRRSEASIRGDFPENGCMLSHSADKNTAIKKRQKSSPLSLVSRLKRQRGTASSTPLPQEWSGISSLSSTALPRFLSPKSINDNDFFKKCHAECYHGFHWEEPNELPQTFHQLFTSTFHALNDAGLFLYDVVQPGGKRLSKTFVTRTLIGSPGSTYRYLGLRLFSHPWCDIDEIGDEWNSAAKNRDNEGNGSVLDDGLRLVNELGYTTSCAKALLNLGKINQTLIHRTNNVLNHKIAPTITDGLIGSAEYSLTLINRMEPTSVKKDLKVENIHGGLGKTSVSWHKDSGLQDFSSIAVYHALEGCSSNENDHNTRSNDDDVPWRVALRVADSTTKTPALAVPLPSGSLYYLLDDFNHQHEHAVLAGSNKLRYSSTHRVAREGCGTWQYIRDKCESVLSSSNLISKVISISNDGQQIVMENNNEAPPSSLHHKRKLLVKEVRSYLMLMAELEFEWIRQWQIQGQHHADLHPYWLKPIHIMTQTYLKLRESCSCIVQLLKKSSFSDVQMMKGLAEIISEDLFDVIIEEVQGHQKLRSTWRQRLKDPIFASLVKEMRPISSAIFEAEEKNDSGIVLPNVSDLRKWRSNFVALRDSGGCVTHGKKKKTKTKSSRGSKKESYMTKKERKKIPSNWERMKAQMKH